MGFEQSRVLVDADPDTGTYCATYHYPSRPPSTTIPLALMEITDSDVIDLDPFYETAGVNPDALDNLFDPTTSGGCHDGCITFTYQNYTVLVRGYGRIVLQTPATATDALG